MAKLVLLGILTLLLLSPAWGADVPGGVNVVVTGGGSQGNGSQPPVVVAPNQGHNTRDPSSYVVPATPIPTRHEPSSSSNSISEESSPVSVASGETFIMTGEVTGQGKFSTFKNLGGGEGESQMLGQRSSAHSGDLTDSSLVIYAKEYPLSTDSNSYAVNLIRSEDDIMFVGRSYSEFSRVFSGTNRIVDQYSAGAINKSSSYTAYLSNVTTIKPTGDLVHNNAIFTFQNTYGFLGSQTSSRFVGIHLLDASINGTEVAQEFTGRFAEERKMNGVFSSNITTQDLDLCTGCA